MTKKEILITKEGLEKLQAELEELIKVRRPDVINRIKTAKELGDLSENAEYTAAKEDQSFIEGRIQELEQTIKQGRVVTHANSDAAGIGSALTVEVEGEQDRFELVGPAESDPENGRISVDSPVGRALLGSKAKDKITVQTPEGSTVYTVITVA